MSEGFGGFGDLLSKFGDMDNSSFNSGLGQQGNMLGNPDNSGPMLASAGGAGSSDIINLPNTSGMQIVGNDKIINAQGTTPTMGIETPQAPSFMDKLSNMFSTTPGVGGTMSNQQRTFAGLSAILGGIGAGLDPNRKGFGESVAKFAQGQLYGDNMNKMLARMAGLGGEGSDSSPF